MQQPPMMKAWKRALVALVIFSCYGLAAHAEIHAEQVLFSDTERVEKVAASFYGDSGGSGHTNNWAVLVCTSRFWFNYRHIANTLSIYRTVKRLGIPDSNIILMLADDVACNPRNHFPATVYNNAGRLLDLYGSNIEVDYRGYEVTVESFIRVLTGRHEDYVPRSKRLLTDDRSNILIFMTGHGGKGFLKFQDAEEIGSHDVADAIAQMHEKKRYNEIFFMIDTCQASSMYEQIYTPNVLAAASSLVGESSYSHHHDMEIGTAVIDRWTYSNLETLEKLERQDQNTIQSLFNTYNPDVMLSHPGIRTNLFPRGTDKALITDFFGGVQSTELTLKEYKGPKKGSHNQILPPDAKVDFPVEVESKEADSETSRLVFDFAGTPAKVYSLRNLTPQDYLINAPFLVAGSLLIGLVVLGGSVW